MRQAENARKLLIKDGGYIRDDISGDKGVDCIAINLLRK